MNKRITNKHIRYFFWEAEELPFENKASYLLGDLTVFGVSRCKKIKSHWHGVWYEFDIYHNKDCHVTLIVDLTTDFTLREVEKCIKSLLENGGLLASDDEKTFLKWRNEIMPSYPYEHAKYSAQRFLEALRKTMLLHDQVK
jgi:hypothetical protein